jgi:ABC-2 type transport system permease protein
MLQLLKIEWMKVKNYRTFWILSILYLVSIFGANYIAYMIWDSTPKEDMTNAFIGTPFTFPDVWHMISWVSSFLMFMPGLLIIISITNEYSYKTHRQNVIDGWSRTQFITVKIVNAFIITLVSTLVVFLTAIGFGLLVGDAAITFEKVEFVGYFFIQCLSYTSLALLFSILFKRSGIAIGVYFLYSLILENMLSGILNRYVENIGRYMPLETTDNLIRIPVFKTIVNQVLATYNTPLLLTMSAVYLAAYYFISIRKFQTDDL